MRKRGSAVIIEDGKVALIKRVKSDETYYVFPGGGIEKGETPEQCTVREVLEELGINIKIKHLLATVEFHGTQYFYEVEIISGIFGTGTGKEFSSNLESGLYEPVWIELTSLHLWM